MLISLFFPQGLEISNVIDSQQPDEHLTKVLSYNLQHLGVSTAHSKQRPCVLRHWCLATKVVILTPGV